MIRTFPIRSLFLAQDLLNLDTNSVSWEGLPNADKLKDATIILDVGSPSSGVVDSSFVFLTHLYAETRGLDHWSISLEIGNG